jgi:hypothetical protein
MRTIVAIIVAVVVGVLAWMATSLLWNLLNLARGETGWFARLLVEAIAPGVGSFLGFQAADKVAKQFSLDGLYYGFCAVVITGALAFAIYMLAVSARAGWGAFDWLVTFTTPVGAILGATAGRSTIRARLSGAR